MSLLFFDHLIIIKGLDKKIKKSVSTNEEMQELWKCIDELIHHRVFGCILDNLPEEHHNNFLDRFHKAPHDKEIFKYLKEKTKKDMEKLIKDEIKLLREELLLLNSNKV